MDNVTIERVEASFNLLAPRADELVNRFYERLFLENPAVRAMFPDEMSQQKKKLLASLQLVLANLRTPEKLIEPLKEMGARHVEYGTQPQHYPVVRDTLIAVMADMAGDAWTTEFQDAWTGALNTVAEIMLLGHAGQSSSSKAA